MNYTKDQIINLHLYDRDIRIKYGFKEDESFTNYRPDCMAYKVMKAETQKQNGILIRVRVSGPVDNTIGDKIRSHLTQEGFIPSRIDQNDKSLRNLALDFRFDDV